MYVYNIQRVGHVSPINIHLQSTGSTRLIDTLLVLLPPLSSRTLDVRIVHGSAGQDLKGGDRVSVSRRSGSSGCCACETASSFVQKFCFVPVPRWRQGVKKTLKVSNYKRRTLATHCFNFTSVCVSGCAVFVYVLREYNTPAPKSTSLCVSHTVWVCVCVYFRYTRPRARWRAVGQAGRYTRTQDGRELPYRHGTASSYPTEGSDAARRA